MGRTSWWITFLWVCALSLYFVLGAANLYFGDLNQDEGWYLYAARQVHEGSLPYRDFAFTQGPMLPVIYSLAYPIVERWGVVGGRLITFCFGFAAAIMTAILASRTAPPPRKHCAALLAFILVAGSVYQSYFTTVVKTYSLCATFLVGGFIALSYARERHGGLACFAAGLLLAFSAGTRLSAGAALPITGLYLLFMRRHFGDSRWLCFTGGGAMGLCMISIPFLILAPDGFWFGLVEYHSQRSVDGLFSKLIYKAGFVSRFVQAYFLPVCLAAAIVLFRSINPSESVGGEKSDRLPLILWLVGLAVTLVHFFAPFPYEDYQVVVYPVFAVALASHLISEVGCRISDRWTQWLLVFVFVASVASAFSSPINQSWMISRRDRIWWKTKDETQLQKLHAVSSWISKRLRGNDLLLTQDTYLAVEGGCRVPKGMEMGAFSYFPEMSRARAETLHVLNRELLLELLDQTEASIAAFSGYGLAIQSPQISELPENERRLLWDKLETRYEQIIEVQDFGQAFTTLRIFKLK